MGTNLAVIREGPSNIKAYVEEYLRRSSPASSKYLVTRIRANIDADYAWKPDPPESTLFEMQIAFDVSAINAVDWCTTVDIRVRLDYDGEPRIERTTISYRCPPPWSWG